MEDISVVEMVHTNKRVESDTTNSNTHVEASNIVTKNIKGLRLEGDSTSDSTLIYMLLHTKQNLMKKPSKPPSISTNKSPLGDSTNRATPLPPTKPKKTWKKIACEASK